MTNQLIPIEGDLREALSVPRVRIALYVRVGKKSYQAVGWFGGWTSKGDLRLQEPDSIKEVTIPLDAIEKAYWAPVGYGM